MSKAQVWFLHSSILLITLTGAVYAWMKYAMKSNDPFAVANHPLQPSMLHWHILAAPFAVFGFGWIMTNHIWPKYWSPENVRRKSGLWSMLLLVPMVLSGYLLQVFTDESLLQGTRIAHWASSAIFAIVYLIHQLTKR